MKEIKIGILRGQENSFPDGLIVTINNRSEKKKLGVKAEFVKLSGTKMDEMNEYAILFDRISHEIPYYRTYLKNAMLSGTEVVNNPFWWSADDKFFGYSLAHRLGVAVPKTIVLPSNQHPPNTDENSMRNLTYPLDWKSVFDYIGFPAFLKPHSGGGWKHVYKVHTPEEFFFHYNKTGDLCMTLQEGIQFTEYYRCYCVGRKHVRIMRYDPSKPYLQNYVQNPPPINPALEERIINDTVKLNQALGYDLNTCEFAIRDGIPYAIDFTNPAPDCDYNSVTPPNYEWVVDKVADMLIEKALHNADKHSKETNWSWERFLSSGNGHEKKTIKKK
jgi:glutathione synthase/RimK-type ligase-like ATP-grasp enzyme